MEPVRTIGLFRTGGVLGSQEVVRTKILFRSVDEARESELFRSTGVVRIAVELFRSCEFFRPKSSFGSNETFRTKSLFVSFELFLSTDLFRFKFSTFCSSTFRAFRTFLNRFIPDFKDPPTIRMSRAVILLRTYSSKSATSESSRAKG